MKIIVGLGNVGSKYAKTRHNAGFIALDYLVEKIEKEEGVNIKWKEDVKLKAITAKVPYKGNILFLVKPTTLMNLSGQAVTSVLNFFKEPAENLVIIYDDIDLPLGKVRARTEGSAGTHNGMKSVIQQLGTQKFTRIRIGIESRGTHAPAEQDLSSYVLSDFLENETAELKDGVEKATEELIQMI